MTATPSPAAADSSGGAGVATPALPDPLADIEQNADSGIAIDEVKSVRAMVEWYTTVVVASGGGVIGYWEAAPPFPSTIYAITIDEVIRGDDVKPGDKVPIVVSGGTSSTSVTRPLRGAPAEGVRYLIFMSDHRPYLNAAPGYEGDPRAQFEIAVDGHLIPNGSPYGGPLAVAGISEEQYQQARESATPWEAIRALRGNTLAEAVAVIEGAIAEAPVGEPPWMSGVPTATPSPAPARTAAPTLAPTVTPTPGATRE